MSRQKVGNNQYLKEFNQKNILNLIRVHKQISKAELSKQTGLSPTAIGVIVSGLLEEGYIEETGTGESSGGRRPTLLTLKPRSFFAVGVDLDVNYVNILLMDSTGSLVHEYSMSMLEFADPAKVIAKVEDKIEEILRLFAVDELHLLGIGLSIPGMVKNNRKVILAPNLGWENIDLSEYFKKYGNCPVFIENEAKASAICEHWIGACQDEEDFICINVKSGIGAGMFTGGKLYRGAGGSAGEVGHIMVYENGPKCGCGNYGCLETLASTPRIVDSAKRLIRQGSASSLNRFENADDIDIGAIVEAARSGDEAAKGILNEAARYIGIAISNIVNTLNPSKIVLGKDFVQYADLVLEKIVSTVECKALKAAASDVYITASDIGGKTSALGAAIIPLKVLFGQ